MKINTAEFLVSNQDPKLCPTPNKPEFAFIGRSNVGKSSLINMLCNHKGLAKTSSTPGKTQLINHFLINQTWYLVDLPGFGYAKVSKTKRGEFSKIITGYLRGRQNLVNVYLLLDSRLEPQKIDLEFMEWLGENQIPFSMVFTKTDKITSSVLVKNLKVYKTQMLKTWEELPKIYTTSSTSKMGKEELLNEIGDLVEQLKDFKFV
ncbi:MAG: YihA family ribosome biogenesis GTP-binding protein [Flavobacteriaceae bacterium]|nr:MAG: YihA family ribosome biogenesis GTP-binding protein [Flavobacteriaceae bacterium]